jgi:outer membrane receptor protein involved in Fe transport
VTFTHQVVDVTRQQRAFFFFKGHTDVKELALYIQDQITKGNWSFNVGVSGDFYKRLDQS